MEFEEIVRPVRIFIENFEFYPFKSQNIDCLSEKFGGSESFAYGCPSESIFFVLKYPTVTRFDKTNLNYRNIKK